MAASDHIHPVQLKLFMGAGEWKKSMTDSVDRPFAKDRKMSNLWSEKLTEAKEPAGRYGHGAGLHDDLSTGGYKHDKWDPPTIMVNRSNEMAQGEGHHRIAAAADIERTTGRNMWIPTNYEPRRNH
jgi:hypothetical protein